MPEITTEKVRRSLTRAGFHAYDPRSTRHSGFVVRQFDSTSVSVSDISSALVDEYAKALREEGYTVLDPWDSRLIVRSARAPEEG